MSVEVNLKTHNIMTLTMITAGTLVPSTVNNDNGDDNGDDDDDNDDGTFFCTLVLGILSCV